MLTSGLVNHLFAAIQPSVNHPGSPQASAEVFGVEPSAPAGARASCGSDPQLGLGRMTALASLLSSVLLRLATGALRTYQRFVSPLLRAAFRSECRFYPSCSEYSRQALLRYGLARGLRMTALRLCRCHPFHPGGYDPPEP
jgi:uncharacterized protein